MLEWLRGNKTKLLVWAVTIFMLSYLYACDPQVRSLNDSGRRIGRTELQMELNHFIDIAELRFASLDRQEKLRAIILNNALIVIQGQPFNPFGLITAVAALYGTMQAGKTVKGTIQNVRNKRHTNTTAPT